MDEQVKVLQPSKAERDYAQMYNALKRILAYQSLEQLRRRSQREYGLDSGEAIDYAYENIQGEARAGIKGVRKPA